MERSPDEHMAETIGSDVRVHEAAIARLGDRRLKAGREAATGKRGEGGKGDHTKETKYGTPLMAA